MDVYLPIANLAVNGLVIVGLGGLIGFVLHFRRHGRALVSEPDLLLLDDLGAERANEWVRERIFVIVNHRYREELPTTFTSNTGPKDLAAQLGERTASRIIAMCDWISLEGEDYREAEVRRGL